MGQKISVQLFRAKQRMSNSNRKTDITEQPKSVWFARGQAYSKLLLQDMAMRKFIFSEFKNAGIVEVIIRRYVRKVELSIHTTKPGIIIGRQGMNINKLREDLIKKFDLPKDLKLNIEEFKDPMRSARVIASELSQALEKGVSYRRLAKNYLDKIRYSGVLGAKICIKGRLNGAEIARKEEFAHGSIPRHTIDSVIDYCEIPCKTQAGIIGIKVWLYKGNKLTNFEN